MSLNPTQCEAVDTSKAAAEMRDRIESIAGDRHDVREPWVGTVHSIARPTQRASAI